MPDASARLTVGFIAGFLSHLVFQGALSVLLKAANLVPSVLWSLMPVPPLGVPLTLSLGFWAGLWGIAYALLEPRITARLGLLPGGLVFGIAPLLGHWFVSLPLKGAGVGGGFHLAEVPIHIAFHAVFGIGLAILFRSGLVLARRRGGASAGALRG